MPEFIAREIMTHSEGNSTVYHSSDFGRVDFEKSAQSRKFNCWVSHQLLVSHVYHTVGKHCLNQKAQSHTN